MGGDQFVECQNLWFKLITTQQCDEDRRMSSLTLSTLEVTLEQDRLLIGYKWKAWWGCKICPWRFYAASHRNVIFLQLSSRWLASCLPCNSLAYTGLQLFDHERWFFFFIEVWKFTDSNDSIEILLLFFLGICLMSLLGQICFSVTGSYLWALRAFFSANPSTRE